MQCLQAFSYRPHICVFYIVFVYYAFIICQYMFMSVSVFWLNYELSSQVCCIKDNESLYKMWLLCCFVRAALQYLWNISLHFYIDWCSISSQLDMALYLFLRLHIFSQTTQTCASNSKPCAIYHQWKRTPTRGLKLNNSMILSEAP